MAVPKKSSEQLSAWLEKRGGVAHRDDALRAGFSIARVRAFVRDRHAERARRVWLLGPAADDDIRVAARAGGRVSCASLARRRGWWVPEGVGAELHLHVHPGSTATGLGADWGGVTHWTKPIVPAPASLLATVEDALFHISTCLHRDDALVVWESAARIEGLAAEALRAIPWRSLAARELAEAVTGLSDSGLETLVIISLRRQGLRVRQQIVIAGRPVDLLVGERLVVQIDGYAHHSSSAQRTSDIAHDAELRLRGYTVLRFSYAHVVHDRAHVERTIRRAVAAGLHSAA